MFGWAKVSILHEVGGRNKYLWPRKGVSHSLAKKLSLGMPYFHKKRQPTAEDKQLATWLQPSHCTLTAS